MHLESHAQGRFNNHIGRAMPCQKGWMCCKSYTTHNASVRILKKSQTTRNMIKLVRKLQWFDRLPYWDWQWTACILTGHAILIHKFIETKPQYNAVIFLMSRVLTFTCHFYGQNSLIFFSGLFFAWRSFIKTHWLYRQGARERIEEPVRVVGEDKAEQPKGLTFHCIFLTHGLHDQHACKETAEVHGCHPLSWYQCCG